MDSFRQWVQDWTEACTYARECVPDLSFFVPTEPYSALASIAGACFVIWWWNDRKIKQILLRELQLGAGRGASAAQIGGLSAILDKARTVPPAPENKAA